MPELSTTGALRNILTEKNRIAFTAANALVVKAKDCDKIEGTLGGTAFEQMYGGLVKNGLQMTSGVSNSFPSKF